MQNASPSSVLQNWTNPNVKGEQELCDLDDDGTNESIPTGSQQLCTMTGGR